MSGTSRGKEVMRDGEEQEEADAEAEAEGQEGLLVGGSFDQSDVKRGGGTVPSPLHGEG